MDYVLSTKPLAELQASCWRYQRSGFGALFEAADAMTSGLLGTLVQEEQFKAKSGSSLWSTPNESAKRILIVGLGKHDAFDASVTRSFEWPSLTPTGGSSRIHAGPPVTSGRDPRYRRCGLWCRARCIPIHDLSD